MENSQPSSTPKNVTNIQDGVQLPKEVAVLQKYTASMIDGRFNFLRGTTSGDLYRWNGTNYEICDYEWIKDRIMDVIDCGSDLGGGMGRYNPSFQTNVTAILSSRKERLWPCPPQDQIALAKGVLDLNSMKHRPNDHTWHSTVSLPIRWDPKAKCPLWDAFLSSVFPGDAIEMAWEIIGSCLVPNLDIQEALWLMGIGSNGKSTFVEAVQNLIGPLNAPISSMASLATDKFTTATIQGALMVGDVETEIGALKSSGLFKKIVASDEIWAQHKYGHPFPMRVRATVILAGNHSPNSKDTSAGMFRRLVMIPFGNYTDGTNMRPKSAILNELKQESEKSGAFNKALLGLARLRTRGKHQQPASVLEMTTEFRQDNDPVWKFFEACVKVDPSSRVRSSEFTEAYNQFALQIHAPHFDSSYIGGWISKHHPNVKKGNWRFNGTVQKAWLGMEILPPTL